MTVEAQTHTSICMPGYAKMSNSIEMHMIKMQIG